MQDLSNYSRIQAAITKNEKFIEDLIAISNLKAVNIDTTIVEISGNDIKIEGDRTSLVNEYVVLGHEIAYITSVSYSAINDKTTLTLAREQLGTKQDTIDLTGYYIRSVDIFTDVKSWNYNTYSSSKTQVFPFNLENGQVIIYDSISNWGKGKTYSLKRKKSAIYIFKGFDSEKMLKYVGFADNKSLYGAKYNDAERVKIEFNDKFIQWYNVNIRRQQILKYIKPKEFMVNVLEYPTDMIKYINGNVPDDFNTTNYVFLNEYEKFKDILGEYAKTGVRFYFNELEELCITTDLTVSNLVSTGVNITNTNLLDIQKSDEEGFIINITRGTYYERTALYDFENASQFDSNYVKYGRTLDADAFTLLNSDDEYNTLTITDTNLANYTTQYDLVILKDDTTGFEIHGKIIYYEGTSPNVETIISFQNADKDGWLDYFGRIDYLKTLNYDSAQDFTLHYVRNELPIIYKHQSSFSEDTENSRLNIALRPQIIGESEILLQTSANFGSTSDITDAEYIGQFENIDNIYGTFSNSAGLTYNQELVQFTDPNNYPPLFVLSNRQTNDLGRGGSVVLTYDTFDNSNLEVIIEETDSSEYNAKISFKNTTSISDTLLYDVLKTNRTQITGSLFEINATDYGNISVGDILTLKQPISYTDSNERAEFDSNKNTNWIIERVFENGGSYYIQLNGNIKDTFDFTIYPSTSVVYLQEFYILGNPVIEYTSEFESSNDTSIEEYDEQEQIVDGKLLNFEGVGKLANYHEGFAGIETDESDKKYILPLQIRNHPELQKFDLITITDDIYTGYDGNTDFMILGIEESDITKGDTNKYYVMNINNFDATENTFDVKKILNFIPVNNTVYNSQGNEGLSRQTNEVESNTKIITSNDNTYGSISIKPISTSYLRAKVSSLSNGVLNIDNISIHNSNYENFLNYDNLDNEYKVIRIDNEYILTLIESYSSTTNEANLIIIKRKFLENISTTSNIVENRLVRFYEIISGSFYEDLLTGNLKAGNQTNYIKLDVENGTQIASTGNVSISNKTSILDFNSTLNESSLKLNGTTTGSSVNAGSFIVGKTYIITTVGTTTDWISIGASSEAVGVVFTATGIGSGDGVAEIAYYQFQAGKGLVDSSGGFNGLFSGNGDLTQNNYMKYDGTTLTVSGNFEIISGTGFNNTYRQTTPPTIEDGIAGNANIGDLWFDTDDNDKQYYAFSNGSTIGVNWLLVQDSATAQSAADDALQALTDISTDSIVTPSEKRIVQQSWRDIQSEKIDLNTKTTTIGFTGTELTTYNTKYGLLDTYLNTTITVFVDLTTNTNITRSTWNTTWQDYYDAKVALVNEIGNYVVTYTHVKIGDDALGAGLDGFLVDTTGYAKIQNNNNILYFEPEGGNSYLRTNNSSAQIGYLEGLTGTYAVALNTEKGFFFGDTDTDNGKFISYNDTTFKFGSSTNIAGVIQSGDVIIVENGGDDICKYGEIDKTNNVFGFDFTSPVSPTTEYFRLADSTSGIYTQGMELKTQGTIDISNDNNELLFETGNTINSYLRMNSSSVQLGKLANLTGTYGTTLITANANGLFVGDTDTDNGKYLSYDGTDLQVRTSKGYIGSGTNYFDISNGSISVTSGTVGGWILDSDLLKSASTGARIELNKAKNRISIFDIVNEKVVMGYLENLPKHDASGNWGAGDYGFWAKAGDKLVIDGDSEYVSGDWIVKNDGSYLIQDASDNTIVRLGTDTGEKGVFIYDTSANILAEYSSSRIKIGGGTEYLNYESSLFDLKTQGTIDISNTWNGLYFTDVLNTSYISMNSGEQQIGHVTGLTDKADFDGFYFGNTTLANYKYIYYDGVGLNISGDITVGSTIAGIAASTVKNGAADGTTSNTLLTTGDFEYNKDYISYVSSEFKIGKDAVGVGKHGVYISTTGYVDINNTNNRIYFDPTDTGNSYIEIATGGSGEGRLTIGDTTSDNYFEYTSLGKIEVKSYKLKIVDNLIGLGEDALSIFDSTTKHNIAIGKESQLSQDLGENNISIGYRSMKLDDGGHENIAIGKECMELGTDVGIFNIGIGYQSLRDCNGGESNIGIGLQSGSDITNGKYNVAIGSQSLITNTQGYGNIGIGVQTLYNCNTTTATGDNIAVGFFSQYECTTGINNISMGHNSGRNNTTGINNISLGYESLKGDSSGSSGDYNIAFGVNSLSEITTGDDNIAIGRDALDSLTTGSENIWIGYDNFTPTEISTGSNNICIGSNIRPSSSSVNNEIIIGSGTTGKGSSTTVIANTIYLPNLGNSAATGDVRYNTSTSQVTYDTSSIRYKDNIREDIDTSKIYDIEVVKYDRKDGSNFDEVGIIAEELYEIIPKVVFKKDGEIEGYNKSDLVPYLINELQNQNKIIQNLEARIKNVENK